MSHVTAARGRVLSGKQVRFNEVPVQLTGPACRTAEPELSVVQDPVTGDILSISIRCRCGEITRVACSYQDPTHD